MTVAVTLRNPLAHSDQLTYYIRPADNQLAQDWIEALKGLLQNGNMLEKNFCFMGFADTARDLPYLCQELNQHVATINDFFSDYHIAETFRTEDLKVWCEHTQTSLAPNHDLLNQLHNHFERLQGTVWNLSDYYRRADYETKYSIRQLNNICHEIENLILSQRKRATQPEWQRPSQITTFLNAHRYDLTDQHRQGFVVNKYDRHFGGVYMHWTQIGKTLFEVFRDEGAPELTETLCEAITELRYYSGEFDVEWGRDVAYNNGQPWHDRQQDAFRQWLVDNGRDPNDAGLSLGYLKIAQVDLIDSFGTNDTEIIWQLLGTHLDIYKIEVDGISNTFDYCWSDHDHKQKQIEKMRPGYDYTARHHS